MVIDYQKMERVALVIGNCVYHAVLMEENVVTVAVRVPKTGKERHVRLTWMSVQK